MARLKQEIMADAVAQACAEDLRRQKIFGRLTENTPKPLTSSAFVIIIYVVTQRTPVYLYSIIRSVFNANQ